jgi:hypothetical protein
VYADKHRTERVFAAGDQVFLKLQPYVQSSVVHRANHKLAFRYYGPFLVDKRIGSVTYHLVLPKSSRIHPVFHVSQLKKVVSPQYQVLPTLPMNDPTLQVPLLILQRRLKRAEHKTIAQVLVQWSNSDASTATWEDLDSLRQ